MLVQWKWKCRKAEATFSETNIFCAIGNPDIWLEFAHLLGVIYSHLSAAVTFAPEKQLFTFCMPSLLLTNSYNSQLNKFHILNIVNIKGCLIYASCKTINLVKHILR